MARELAAVIGLPAYTLMDMPSNEQIVVSDDDLTPCFCRKMDYLKDDIFKGYFDPNPFYGNQGTGVVHTP